MPPTENLWQQALASLELEIDPVVVSTWFRNTQLYETTENKLIIACTDAYSKSIIQKKYSELIKKIIKEKTGQKITLEFIVKNRKNLAADFSGPLFDQVPANLPYESPSPADHSYAHTISTTSTTASSANLNKTYSLDNFVVGVSNRVVHAAAVSVVENPGLAYNPLFVYGSTGVGKTHLLHAIGNAILELNSSLSIMYAPTEKFVNDLIEHIQKKKSMEAFRKKYRDCDVILIDDIQFLTGNMKASQEEFYHTFNELHQNGKQIVLASDRKPSEIEGLADRLVSRFKGGLLAMINPPDFETRLAIIKTKSESLQLDISNQICEYIAEKTNGNIREIHGVLQQIRLLQSSQGQLINFGLVKSVLEPDSASSPVTKKITAELILEIVKHRFDSSIKDLCGKRRKKDIVVPRQMAMFLLRNELGMNLADIGEILGGRDHTTIMHGCEKIRNEIEDKSNQYLKTHLFAIRQELYA